MTLILAEVQRLPGNKAGKISRPAVDLHEVGALHALNFGSPRVLDSVTVRDDPDGPDLHV